MKHAAQSTAVILAVFAMVPDASAFSDRQESKVDIQDLALGHRPPDFQGGTVNCRLAKVPNGTPIFSYVIKSTGSRRLGSDILRIEPSTNGPYIISSLNVAQYTASDSSLYMLIDDVNEDPILSFSVSFVRKPKKSPAEPPNTLTYEGRIEEINPADGVVTRIQRVICKLAP